MKLISMLALSLLATGAWTGYSVHREDGPIRIPVVRDVKPAAAPVAPDVMDANGVEPNISAEIIPDAVIVDGKSERLEYHAELASNLDADAAYAWSAVAIDDLGRVVTDIASGEGTIAAHGTAATSSFVVDLPEGFYLLRVRVGAVASELEDATLAVQFLSVSNGVMREMSATDWYRTSRATLMTRDGEEAGAQ